MDSETQSAAVSAKKKGKKKNKKIQRKVVTVLVVVLLVGGVIFACMPMARRAWAPQFTKTMCSP